MIARVTGMRRSRNAERAASVKAGRSEPVCESRVRWRYGTKYLSVSDPSKRPWWDTHFESRMTGKGGMEGTKWSVSVAAHCADSADS